MDPKDFVPFAPGRGFTARRLDLEQEKAVLLHLLEDCSDEDLDLADIDLNDLDPVIYGIFTEGQMVAYASHYYWDDVIADIGVLVHPGFQGRGLGKAVVSSLCEWCFENEIVPMYRVFDFNSISIKLSRDIGFKELVIIKSIKTREKENS